MNKTVLIACLALVTFAVGAQDDKSVVRSKKTTVKATVIDVDRGDRELTIRGPRGKSKLKVGEEVKNFDQIKEGDQIQATYYESVAYSVAKKGEAPATPAESGAIAVAAKGEKPSGAMAASKRATATVEEINPDTREITLQGPEGNRLSFKVDERVGDISNIKKGDEIVATYTESLAISVIPEK